MAEKRHTIAVQPTSGLLPSLAAFRAHCAALPHLGSCYGATEQEALDRMAAVIDASQSPEWPKPDFALPPTVGFVTRATHDVVVAENAALRTEVARLKQANRALRSGNDLLLRAALREGGE